MYTKVADITVPSLTAALKGKLEWDCRLLLIDIASAVDLVELLVVGIVHTCLLG